MQDLNNDFTTSNIRPHQDVDIKFLVAKVIGNWYWYVLSVILFLGLGVLIYIYTSPRYTVTGRVLVTGYNSQGKQLTGTDESTVLSDLGLFSIPNSVSNELEIIHSRTLVEKTVRDLQLNVSYWGQGDIRYEEVYKNSPYFIKILWLKNIPEPVEYDVRVINNKVKFEDEDTDSTFTASFGDTLHFNYGSWVLESNPNVIETNPNHQLGLIINSYNATLYAYMDEIEAMTTNEYVNIIDLSIDGPTPEKNEDMLKHLIGLYVQADIADHTRIADSTIAFIDDRLVGVSQDLNNIDRNIESFKKENRLTDLSDDAKELVQTTSTVSQTLAQKDVELKVVEDLEQYLMADQNATRVMPTTAPIQDPAFVQTLDKYNTLQLQRQSYLQNSTEANPAIKNIDIQLRQLRGDLLSMMSTYKKSIATEQADLQTRNSQMFGQISKVPTQERIYLDFTRRQNVMQALYLYLLQTREQTAVSKSNNFGPIRVIDQPTRGPLPYFPNVILIVAAAIFLGLLIPSVSIFLKELLNTRVITSEDITNVSNVPVVATVSHSKSGKPLVVSKDSRHEIAEQFRTLRTNLQFLMPNPSEKVIMTTSSMGGEGKSFVAMNLAYSIAISGKRVLLMELDLRKPRITDTLNVDNHLGFSNYVISEATLNDIIKGSDVHPNFYVLGSGSFAPNPAELLVHEKVVDMFAKARNEFDYVVIDCSPVGLVTDALLLSRFADVILYVVRQRFTYKKQVNIIQALANDRKFKKIDIIFNDVKPIPGYGYGYGYGNSDGYKYGYSYYAGKRSFFQRLFGLNKTKKARA